MSITHIIAFIKDRIARWQSDLETEAGYQKRTGFHPTVRPQYGDVILYCEHISVFSGTGPIMTCTGGVSVARHVGPSDVQGIGIQVDWIATCPECLEQISYEPSEGTPKDVRLCKPYFKLNGSRIIWKWPLP